MREKQGGYTGSRGGGRSVAGPPVPPEMVQPHLVLFPRHLLASRGAKTAGRVVPGQALASRWLAFSEISCPHDWHLLKTLRVNRARGLWQRDLRLDCLGSHDTITFIGFSVSPSLSSRFTGDPRKKLSGRRGPYYGVNRGGFLSVW